MEDEDTFPPPREEEEDLGPWTSHELHQAVGTAPSRSLLDDLLESSARCYHKNIAVLLLATRKLCKTRLEAMCEDLNRLIQKNPTWKKKQKDEACDYANVAWEKERADAEEMLQAAAEPAPVST